MKRWYIPFLILTVTVPACSSGESAQSDMDVAATLTAVTVPEEFTRGEALFNANCATCHGQRALGSERGPPLAHIIYEPNHHADMAFVMAAERGVRAHHWQFGDMPPVPGVTRTEVDAIIGYVRFLQRQVGIN